MALIHETPKKERRVVSDADAATDATIQESFFKKNRRLLASGAALLAGGVAMGVFIPRGGGDNEAPIRDRGALSGPITPGVGTAEVPLPSQSNVSPAPNSGGFNNKAGRVILRCLDSTVVESLDDEKLLPGHHIYKITPQVGQVVGRLESPYLYTVVSDDIGNNVAQQGLGPVTFDAANSTVFPVVNIIDIYGTRLQQNPDALNKPFGDAVPDSQIFSCPPVEYPGS